MKKTVSMLVAASLCWAVLGGMAMAAEKQDRVGSSAALVEQLYGKNDPTLVKDEPEFSAVMQRHIYGDVQAKIVNLSLPQRELLTIAALAANGTCADIAAHTQAALKAGATPNAVRETVFHTAAYIGQPKAKAALLEVHKGLKAAGVKLPLATNGTVTEADRYEKGLAVQTGIFGQRILDGYKASPADAVHFQYFLSQNCFGDYYTRTELDLKMRELITFAIIATLGGCEPQLTGHAGGNLAVGNSRQDLLDVVTLLQPYNGYPRTLNALAVVNKVAPAPKAEEEKK